MDRGIEFLAQDADQGGEEDVPYAFDAQGKHLCHKDVFESVHCKSGETVGFAEYEATALEVGLAHDGSPVGDGIA